MKLFSEHVSTFYIKGKQYRVFGCWDSETPENETDFYDVYEGLDCINEGNPLFVEPNRECIKKLLE